MPLTLGVRRKMALTLEVKVNKCLTLTVNGKIPFRLGVSGKMPLTLEVNVKKCLTLVNSVVNWALFCLSIARLPPYSGDHNPTLTHSYNNHQCYAAGSVKWYCLQNYEGTIRWKVSQPQLKKLLANSEGTLVKKGYHYGLP